MLPRPCWQQDFISSPQRPHCCSPCRFSRLYTHKTLLFPPFLSPVQHLSFSCKNYLSSPPRRRRKKKESGEEDADSDCVGEKAPIVDFHQAEAQVLADDRGVHQRGAERLSLSCDEYLSGFETATTCAESGSRQRNPLFSWFSCLPEFFLFAFSQLPPSPTKMTPRGDKHCVVKQILRSGRKCYDRDDRDYSHLARISGSAVTAESQSFF